MELGTTHELVHGGQGTITNENNSFEEPGCDLTTGHDGVGCPSKTGRVDSSSPSGSFPHNDSPAPTASDLIMDESPVLEGSDEADDMESVGEDETQLELEQTDFESNLDPDNSIEQMQAYQPAINGESHQEHFVKPQQQWGGPLDNNENNSLRLLSLPIDSLHCVASFLNACDWANFGRSTTLAAPICRDVFQRVRMHGFRCATEVVTAWKLGQHADARELAALYIHSGVPIYPLSLGHSYHTLVWRMGIETKKMEENQALDPPGNNENENTSDPVDPFFVERYHTRIQDTDDTPTTTYLEEKCEFLFSKAAETDSRFGTRLSMTSRTNFAPPAPILGGGMQGAPMWDGRTRLPDFRPGSGNRAGTRSSPSPQSPTGLVYQDSSRVPPKINVTLHSHLLNQHLLGRRAIDDENGGMVTPPISLAADFYHQNVAHQPFAKISDPSFHHDDDSSTRAGSLVRKQDLAIAEMPSAPMTPLGATYNLTPTTIDSNFPHETLVPVRDVAGYPASHLETNQTPPPPAFGSTGATLSPASRYETPLQLPGSFLLPSPPPPPLPTPDELIANEFSRDSRSSILSSVNLEVYSSTSASVLTDNREGTNELKSHLKTRFGVYQRRLETLLSQSDSPGFEECLLDFWDEFLSVTSNIHFHDRNTAVPRISGLQKFLSKPCPKAIGVVQCEIERIKINAKRKGVNMTGRLFPTYEYRLFIRDKRHGDSSESAPGKEGQPFRRDSVLMMARNKGRKHQEGTGITPAPGSSRKGVNNYYLYMPQQVDVDTHYRSVNNSVDGELIPNGAGTALPTRTGDNNAPVLLGRLQSNFIGTEFQIFTPSAQKQPGAGRKPVIARSSHPVSSDSESDYEVSSDTASATRRRNRFRRRTRRANSNLDISGDHSQPDPIDEEESIGSPSSHAPKTKRSYSLPNFRRTSRSSRRAVANSLDSPISNQQQQPKFFEEEDGAITYTANLLGNRPRIMDVCVPKVSNEGVPGAEWKRYLGSVEETTEAVNSMLNHFKQLQQRLETNDPNNNDEENGSVNSYSPPSDFGLLALQNRPPWWNVELGAFVLNFGGRVSVASVKNFQLCDRNDQDHIMLQFGRIQGRHSFTMDFQHPLTAVQAFAIAISSLQSRISFG